MINISEESLTQHFNDSTSSFSKEKRIKLDNSIYIPCEAIKHKNVHVLQNVGDKFK